MVLRGDGNHHFGCDDLPVDSPCALGRDSKYFAHKFTVFGGFYVELIFQGANLGGLGRMWRVLFSPFRARRKLGGARLVSCRVGVVRDAVS